MSAYIVDEAHIDVLVDIAQQYARTSRYSFYWCWGLTYSRDRSRDIKQFTPTELGRKGAA